MCLLAYSAVQCACEADILNNPLLHPKTAPIFDYQLDFDNLDVNMLPTDSSSDTVATKPASAQAPLSMGF